MDAEQELEALGAIFEDRTKAIVLDVLKKHLEVKPIFHVPQAPISPAAKVEIIKQELPAVHIKAPEAVVKFDAAVLHTDDQLGFMLDKIAGLLSRSLLPREKIVTVTRDGQGNITEIRVREEIKG